MAGSTEMATMDWRKEVGPKRPRWSMNKPNPLEASERYAQLVSERSSNGLNGEVRLCIYNQIDWSVNQPVRAGILPYILNEQGEPLFCFGDDAQHGELTDMGGGISKKRDREPNKAALREFLEESQRVFPDITLEELNNCLVIYDDQTLIFLKKVDVNPDLIVSNFQQKITIRSELCGLHWINRENLSKLLRGKKVPVASGLRQRSMYSLVRDLLHRGQVDKMILI